MTIILDINFTEKVKISKVDDEGIIFTDGSQLGSYHDQDCCEHVYANWEDIKGETPDIWFMGFSIEGVSGSGLNILLYPNTLNKYIYIRLFVPCYNHQNGYYSSNLALIYTSAANITTTVDITDFVEDNYY